LFELDSGTMRELAVRDIDREQLLQYMTWESRDTLLVTEC
jgi:hypothetical protein